MIALFLFAAFAAALLVSSKKVKTPSKYVLKKLGPDANKFCDWAFGKDWEGNTPVCEMRILWNDSHPEMKLEPDGLVFDDIDRMIALWQKEVHGKDHLVPPIKDG